MYEEFCILIGISINVPKGPIGNKSTLLRVMVWLRIGNFDMVTIHTYNFINNTVFHCRWGAVRRRMRDSATYAVFHLTCNRAHVQSWFYYLHSSIVLNNQQRTFHENIWISILSKYIQRNTLYLFITLDCLFAKGKAFIERLLCKIDIIENSVFIYDCLSF